MPSVSWILNSILVVGLIGSLWGVGAALIGIMKGTRRSEGGSGWRKLYNIALAAGFYGWIGYCLYECRRLFAPEQSAADFWREAPASGVWAVVLLFAILLLIGIYLTLAMLYPKEKERPYGSMLLLSFVSGIGNASMIFVINSAIAGSGDVRLHMLPYFILGMLFFVFGQRLLRLRLIRMTNGIVYDKRMEVITNILNAPYENVETMERGKIETCLNNDTEVVSSFANKLVSIGTWSVTITAGFVYLAFISMEGFLLSLGVVFLASILFFTLIRSANRLWEQTRDIQNVFFKFIHDLIYGFKELYLHRNKARDFRDNMGESCLTYRDKRMMAESKVANVVVIGDLLFAAVIGCVVFVFPYLFANIQEGSLRSFVFVFLYMAGPLTSILNSLPELFQARISWNRMKQFSKDLSGFQERAWEEERLEASSDVSLKLEEARYEYRKNDDGSFAVGPIDYEFRSGELIFIVGGNGSGKSTLAKLITGLYEPKDGIVTLNGKTMSAGDIGQHVSTIFSDAYLFDRLYGIDFASKEEEANSYLRLLGLQNKVRIQDGRFSTTQLSSGQRKRLALLVSYLDDKPICLFDEWAADQDPEYREFFYTNLLPDLKNRGKCVIVITHDDRYFDMADKVIKMEMGRIA
ncbi:cyclic peptide export ABC transporter [Paenibacillus oenotherae]|uniref:Cyclic peptide export ABC transporter n=1 Tax=Paenibacillus oenotherae TaxID=1435645 RepID=A0ABS7D922_9BACL|nr:cyclic peptide export ABC transporter [Paenibacillus oenotherae]MBW7476452.1 cyclic peptide export ABC transporter [Paenibacillus oenotherae]